MTPLFVRPERSALVNVRSTLLALLLASTAYGEDIAAQRARHDEIPLRNWRIPGPEWNAPEQRKIAPAGATDGQFVAVTPCRVVDTRLTGGGGQFSSQEVRTYDIVASTCGTNSNIPRNARSFSLNITVVSPSTDGHLIAFPAGLAQPNVSVMNYTGGQIIANAAIVSAGTSADTQGKISIYSYAPTHLIIDINGYFTGLPSTVSNLIQDDGSIGIGTTMPATGKKLHVVGDAQFDGVVSGTNIKAKYQDVAEWVPSTVDIPDAAVVILDPSHDNHVTISTRPYDTTVAGVVSAEPGLLLGEESDGMEKVATTGRVKVRVDATKHAIRIGDLLVTGEKPGTAMKSVPVNVNGAAMHRPGTIIGKALEPLSTGEGEILVLLSLQ